MPNRWANGGTWMGRKEALLDYFDAIEGYLVTNVKSQGDGDGFRRACKPYGMSDAEYAKRTVAAGFFDDQTCLNRFIMENAGIKNDRVVVDMDGSVMLSVGGTDFSEFKTAKDGSVYWEKTQKAPVRVALQQPGIQEAHPESGEDFPVVLGVKTRRVGGASGEKRESARRVYMRIETKRLRISSYTYT